MNIEESVVEQSTFEDTTVLVVTAKKSNNQLFKEQYGYSKSLANLAKKYNTSIEGYRKIRAANRKAKIAAMKESLRLRKEKKAKK